MAKSTRKLNRWVCNVQREVSGDNTNLEDDNKESKIGFMGLMSMYCIMTAMNMGNTIVFKGKIRRRVLKNQVQECPLHTQKCYVPPGFCHVFCLSLRNSSYIY